MKLPVRWMIVTALLATIVLAVRSSNTLQTSTPKLPLPIVQVVQATQATPAIEFEAGQRIAFVGNSLAERMNLFGHFETLLHTRFPSKNLVIRNFGWPTDEVALQQRPDNYTKIDDPLEVFAPNAFVCFFGFNESYAGDSPEKLDKFISDYRQYLDNLTKKFGKADQPPKFVLVSPIAFEVSGNPLHPNGADTNKNLKAYSEAIRKLALERKVPFVDVFEGTSKAFAAEQGLQFTINGAHVNEQGDRLVSRLIDEQLFKSNHPLGQQVSKYEQIREWVVDKSWYHLQDYRMLNGWYVYGGRRTWDTETFPLEYKKIRNMVAVRDQRLWDMASDRPVPAQPDDSKTGELIVPETMFGTRDEKFRKGREPETLKYTTPEESIAQMKLPEGFEVKLFASEREFPELAKPNQLTFDSRGRLWVSCMTNYPQWLPGMPKPNDRLLIFEDTNGDGKADKCKTFYDKLICPTGFEFWQDGVLVVDEPRILFIKDTDGDDKADQVIHLIDGVGTDDTHHTVGAFEYSHGGRLYMLEGVSISTDMETPWGPFRRHGASGGYILDPHTLKFTHFRTPGYGNPWCMVFDKWGNGIVGDGTNAQQHWTSPLTGSEVSTRRTLTPVFDNEGMRPAVGNEFLYSRHFPDDMQGQFIYACVINMHGMPRFTLKDEANGAGFEGKRIDDLLSSTDMFFRPVDPQIGPDGALWFGDWCSALIGHMQYSQRDPNREHIHGRVYRMVNKNKPLLQPITQYRKSIPELLEQLKTYEPRVRYRARVELRSRKADEVLAAVKKWIANTNDPATLCEAMWIQESFRSVDKSLISKLLKCEDFHARAAAVATLSNESERIDGSYEMLLSAIGDSHPRVRLEAVRALSYFPTMKSVEAVLSVAQHPVDYWIDYTLEHTLHALEPAWGPAQRNADFLASAHPESKSAFNEYLAKSRPGGQAAKPLKAVDNQDISEKERQQALQQLVKIRGGNAKNGQLVFSRVCAACHKIGDVGKEFGPALHDVGTRLSREDLIKSIVWPNEKIAKGFETISVVTADGVANSGFVLKETDKLLTLGIANGKTVDIDKEEIEVRKEMKASSMPEGLMKTVAPIEFLDLVEYLSQQRKSQMKFVDGGWLATALPNQGELRKRAGYQEISRNAAIKTGNWPEQWNREADMLLSAADPGEREFAIHSPDGKGTASPAVIIKLPEPKEVRHVWIENRRNSAFYNRAQNLTVWVSKDGNNWEPVWKTDLKQGEWDAEVPAGHVVQYVKVGLDGQGILHLNRVAVFGR